MRGFGKFLGRFLGAVVVIGFGLWVFGPYEPVELDISFDSNLLDGGVDQYLEAKEAAVNDVVEGAQKRVVWAADVGAKTPISVIYLHGFSASSQEIRPVPDRVAQAFGANLVYTRFGGHGIDDDGAQLAAATVGDWMRDAGEALAIGRAVGERVVILSTSTGGTIAAELLLQDRDDVAAVIFVSPNFEINNDLAFLLTWPGARYWMPIIAGAEREFETISAEHAMYWTHKYPTVAVMALAALVKHAAGQEYATVTVPALFYYSDNDSVVVPATTDKIMENWGGETKRGMPDLQDGDDPNEHVIAGDIRSPGNTEAAVSQIVAWLRGIL